MRGEGALNDLKVTNSLRFPVAIAVLEAIASAFSFGWPHRRNAGQGHRATS
jgi:hypothetical protein